MRLPDEEYEPGLLFSSQLDNLVLLFIHAVSNFQLIELLYLC